MNQAIILWLDVVLLEDSVAITVGTLGLTNATMRDGVDRRIYPVCHTYL